MPTGSHINSLRRLTNFVVSLAIILFPFVVPLSHVSAANLGAAWIHLSRMQSNLNGAGANAVIMFVGFYANNTTTTNSTLTIDFATDAGWCRNAGTLEIDRDGTGGGDVLDPLTESSNRTGNWVVDAYIPDGTTIAASCATTGTTFTITNIGNLTAGTTYGFYISSLAANGTIGTPNNTGELASIVLTNGATSDTAIFDVELLASDQVIINATVADAATITCVINGGGTVNLGTLFRNGAPNSGSHTISTTTSADASNGYYWTIYGTGNGTDAGLYKSTATTYLLTSDDTVGAGSTPGSTSNLTTTEGFGVTASAGVGGETIPANFGGTNASSVGLLGNSGVDGAQLLMYKTTAQTVASNATINYFARAGATAQVGSYTETVILTCGLYF